jgi:cyclic-di-GMP-binding protein
MPSFDIVSEIDAQEVRNAVENSRRELEGRFDFRGVQAAYEWTAKETVLSAEAEFQLQQMLEILRKNLVKRKVDINALEAGEPSHSGKTFSLKVTFKQGIDQPMAKKLVQLIKDSKLKVQASIQGDQVRVTGKKRDDLQAAIALVRGAELKQPFQFTNFRD